MDEISLVLRRLALRYRMVVDKKGVTFTATHQKVNPNVLCFGWEYKGKRENRHALIFFFTRALDNSKVVEYRLHNVISLYDVDDAESFEGVYKTIRRIQAGPGCVCPYV